jgi:hypothetical protein
VGEYEAIKDSVEAPDHASIERRPHYTPPDRSGVPTVGEWALMCLAQKRNFLFEHYDGERKWALGGRATTATCDAAHLTALEIARAEAVVLAPAGSEARDPDANDRSKGPAEHEALLRTRRGDGPPPVDLAQEDRVSWMRRNLGMYYADKMAWFKGWPGMSHGTTNHVPSISQTPRTQASNPFTPLHSTLRVQTMISSPT